MAIVPRGATNRAIEYPSGDGKPMAETDIHRDDMTDLIQTLKDHFAADPMTYVSGNLLLYYVEGNSRKHVAPDVFVVHGVKNQDRDNYLVWEEGKGPDMVIELTSKSTRREDRKTKKVLFRDVLKVPEYYQFDPTEDYLKPPLQGFRLIEGDYVPIEPVAGRLPSQVLGLHLERDGKQLRLYDPATGSRLLTRSEERDEANRRAAAQTHNAAAERQKTAMERLRADAERLRAEAEQNRAAIAETAAQALEEENRLLREELEALRRRASRR
jgi:Uma2 family endonuclease